MVRRGFGVQNRGREEADVFDSAWNIDRACERDRLARIDTLCTREAFEIVLEIGRASCRERV